MVKIEIKYGILLTLNTVDQFEAVKEWSEKKSSLSK